MCSNPISFDPGKKSKYMIFFGLFLSDLKGYIYSVGIGPYPIPRNGLLDFGPNGLVQSNSNSKWTILFQITGLYYNSGQIYNAGVDLVKFQIM